jgi:hypothetical protein
MSYGTNFARESYKAVSTLGAFSEASWRAICQCCNLPNSNW